MKIPILKIPYSKKSISNIKKGLTDIIKNGNFTMSENVQKFEKKFSSIIRTRYSIAVNSGTSALEIIFRSINVENKYVIVPTNTFMATPLAVLHAGGKVIFCDIDKNDLCLSYNSLKNKIKNKNIAAVVIVHIGGIISANLDNILKLCRKKKIPLVEDCAHAHGAEWNGKKPGSWGDAGVYSMYATKTISTGEGGILVSKHQELIDYCYKFRNYGKFEYDVQGLNYRMSEFTAALGVVQTKRMPEIVNWKNDYAENFLDTKYSNRVIFPDGMKSGYYKYIVFDELEKSTGKVYDESCHRLMEHDVNLPNTDWIVQNHWCVPLYYHPELEVKK